MGEGRRDGEGGLWERGGGMVKEACGRGVEGW